MTAPEERLMEFIFPTRYKWRRKVMNKTKTFLWRFGEGGPVGWVADRADDYGTHLGNRAAEKKS